MNGYFIASMVIGVGIICLLAYEVFTKGDEEE